MARGPDLIPIDDLVDVARPIKALLRRFAYLLLIGVAVTLILIGNRTCVEKGGGGVDAQAF